jgi:DNA polymerase III delta subunit
MLALFYGTDRRAVRDAAKAYTDAVGVSITTVDEAQFIPGEVAASVGVASLFGGVECFLLDTPSNDADFETEVMGSLAEMAASTNVFVVLEGQLLAEAKRKYGKHATTVEEYTAQKEERFNVFQIAEAFAKKDKKQMWVLLQQARALGIRDEETIGIIWWQLKSLRLAKLTKSAEEAGMKDYPYKKASQSLRNFKDGEIESFSRSLLELYHEGHQGKRELDVAFEQWVLTI